MPLLPRLASLWRNLFHKARKEKELSEELDAYLEMLIEQKRNAGLTEEAARRAALLELGGKQQVKEQVREARVGNWLETVGQDVRYAIRMLRKQPGFTLIAVVTLALGIGANTAFFTLFYSFAWRPLSVKDPSSLVNLTQTFAGDKNYGRRVSGYWQMFSYPEYAHYRDQTHSFSGLAAYTEETFTLSGGEARHLNGQMVTDNYFSILGGAAAMGRVFVAQECQTPGACPQVVLSYGFWQRQFGADPNLIGQTLTLNQRPLTVIGVAARNFSGTEMVVPDVWIPLTLAGELKRSGREQTETSADYLALRDFSWLTVIGRLKPGVSLAQARIDTELAASQSDENDLVTTNAARQTKATLQPATLLNLPEARGKLIPAGLAAMVAFGLVLFVVCANVSNLLLARATTRRKELGVRLALGASRGRLIRQLLTESLMLAQLGGVGGLLLATWLPPLFLSAAPIEGLYVNLNPDWMVFVYCFLASLLTAALFGVAPALQATRLNVVTMMKAEGASFGAHGGARLRHSLVITQVAVSFMLLIGAGLLVRAVQRAQSVDLGFESQKVLALSLDLAAAGYDAPRAAVFYQELTERLAALPEVETVSLSSAIPYAGTNTMQITVESNHARRRFAAHYNAVSARYFQTLGIPILHGRSFSEQDVRAGLSYVVISQAMAARCWPNEDPLGKRFNAGYEVIGVARDVSSVNPGEPDGPFFYAPARAEEQLNQSLLIRLRLMQPNSSHNVREMARALDGKVAVSVQRLEANLERKLQPARFGALFSSALGLLALALVALGAYGVMAFLVSQRTREVGIRLALGARRTDVLRLILRQGLMLMLIGLGIGLAGALLLTRLLASVLYGVSATDAATFVSVTALLGIVTLLACWIPARRATKVDPSVALRCE